MLYVSPVWSIATKMCRYKSILLGLQRKMALRVTGAYRIVSTEVDFVVRGRAYQAEMRDDRQTARDETLRWQSAVNY